MADNRIRILASLDDKVSSGLDKIRDKLDTVGGKGTAGVAFGVVAAKGFALIGGAALGAGQAIGNFIHDSIGAASDLNETISKAHVVFGSATTDVEQWGKTAAKSMGLSENAAIGAAASIGNLLLSTGTAAEKIAPMSKGIVQLASDLASFNNIPVEDALAKLQSGLVGQERPLRELGVAISAASVDAEALALGFKKVNGEFTEGQKVQARYSLIFKQTGTAQGDFAKTSDQLANSQRIMKAELEDVSAKFGQNLLPIVLSTTRALNDLFGAISGGTRDSIQGLEQETADMIAHGAKLQDWADHLVALKKAQVDLNNSWHTPSESESLDRSIAATTDVLARQDFVAKDLGGNIKSMADRFPPAAGTIDAAGNKIDSAIDGVGTAAKNARTDVDTSFKTITERVKTAASDLVSAGQDVANAIYDPLIKGAELAANARDIAEQRQIIASKNSTTAQIADARLRILELQKTRIETLTELASYGDTSAKTTLEHQLAILESSKTLSADQRAEIALLRTALAKLEASYDTATAAAKLLAFWGGQTTHTPQETKGGHFAEGGHYSAGEPRIVGERGPELDIPDHSGYILPQVPQGGGMTSTVVHTHIYLDGREIAEVVDPHLYRRVA